MNYPYKERLWKNLIFLYLLDKWCLLIFKQLCQIEALNRFIETFSSCSAAESLTLLIIENIFNNKHLMLPDEENIVNDRNAFL